MTEERVFRPSRRELRVDLAAALCLVPMMVFGAVQPDFATWLRVTCAVACVAVPWFFVMTATRVVTVTPDLLEVRRFGSCVRFDRSRVEVRSFGVFGTPGITVTRDGRTTAFVLTSFGFQTGLALARALEGRADPT